MESRIPVIMLAAVFYTAAANVADMNEKPLTIGLVPPPNVCEDHLAGKDPEHGHPPPQELPLEILRIIADGQVYEIPVEVASSPETHDIGMMYRHDQPDGQGMLFTNLQPREDGQIGVWMKDTYIPLDIIFIDENGRIVSIAQGSPCDETPIWSGAPAHAFLELEAGMAEALGLKPGDIIDHEYFNTPKTAPDGEYAPGYEPNPDTVPELPYNNEAGKPPLLSGP